ncbi:ferric-rhodotorulic acid/ferric-coprogen receptor FhuE [Stenotrophomonas sp. TWI143]|jgi:outer membrane receptor for ferric coprogen and ferric-rhodotorulic acid|uniref:ferric-rhodotorulic acid/ferric-coprogen receptor FhuE n=1 Tax=Stenotrophomonas TaxID=40323 RepID=UPI0021C85002|nr:MULTISPECIES: ferric-rhodotorulic acid/ferric-coprogen receptor FhuE [Stenotrophomonas]MCU1022759.1 ferric-rhodotorulic acid/ferric-coprogen receptor FhuE [Stenotrophomonas maltophilia]MDI9250164.1 ferric-rhodotorulic acid/ferric-coprogen receptor FhuE [Stenotrophomonas sp. RS-48]MDZ5840352.1 ferric-rhodotorulic acid/ferric-coprogen receptor FhuE [Stenotrophomonas maltophilia]UXY47831.1 ferric-rhodotorulic acid/ferric-coprogen receptor FhuE [Stenotrophomonas maltophilia]HDS1219958.1 ferric-
MNRPAFRIPQPQRLSVAVLAALCAIAPTAFAETATDATTLDKVVVKGERAEGYSVRRTSAGTRFDLTPREIPQSVSIISHQRIEDQNLDDIIDVLANTTGVTSTQSDSERTEFYARGFYIDSYQFDGLPTQMVQNWSYGDSGLDLALYDRVEVVRGATGLLSGAGNPSASVNLIRKHADSAELAGSVSVNVGSWGRTRTTVDVGSALNTSGTVRGRVIGSYLDTDAQMDRYNQHKTLGYAVIDADLTPDTQLSVGYDYQQKRANGATWGGFPMLFSDGSATGYDESFNASPNWTYWDTTSKRAFATLQHAFSNGWKFKVGATHDETKADDKLFYPAYNDWTSGASFFDRTTGTGISPSAGFYNTERKVNAVDGYIDGPFRLFGREHQFMAGLSYNKREYANYGDYQIGGPGQSWDPFTSYLGWTGDISEPNWNPLALASEGTITQKAGYMATRLSLADPLKLIVGARYTDWKSEGEGADRSHKVTTPYAGLVLDINDTFSTYAAYTEIFQPQTLKDRNGSYLDPVDGKSYEVGVKGAWFDNRLNASLAVFRIEQDNVGQATGEPVQGSQNEFAYRAARGTVSRGFEFELNGELAPGWNATFGASRYVAKDANDADINTNLPQTALKLFTSYTPQSLQALTVGGGANWQNRIYYAVPAYGRIEQNGYALVSAFVRYRISPEFSVQANLNNLLDKQYLSQINGYGAYGDGRNGSLTFTWSF